MPPRAWATVAIASSGVPTSATTGRCRSPAGLLVEHRHPGATVGEQVGAGRADARSTAGDGGDEAPNSPMVKVSIREGWRQIL